MNASWKKAVIVTGPNAGKTILVRQPALETNVLDPVSFRAAFILAHMIQLLEEPVTETVTPVSFEEWKKGYEVL